MRGKRPMRNRRKRAKDRLFRTLREYSCSGQKTGENFRVDRFQAPLNPFLPPRGSGTMLERLCGGMLEGLAEDA
jgi:hypothetical protein